MNATLEQALRRAAELPEPEQEAFGSFLLDELALLAAIREGIKAADEGRLTPLEDVEKMIPKWISESSSPSRP